MAVQEGKKSTTRGRTLTYFFLNGMLHQRLHINRGTDELTAWCYPKGKRVVLSYAQTRRDYQPAFSMRQVEKLLNRGRQSLQRAIMRGDLAEPPYSYTLDEHRRKRKYFWDEQSIMDAHAYFASRHFGRPRNDGKTTPKELPTPRELRAMIRQEPMLYVKDGEEYVPTWAASDF